MEEITAQQKETAREYLRQAFAPRKGRWFLMEEIKAEAPTKHSIRSLCTRGAEAVKDGELINRYRAGKDYKEWSWLGADQAARFFLKLDGQFSDLCASYSDVDAQARRILCRPQDVIAIYRGSHEQPVFMNTVNLTAEDLISKGYAICSDCHGAGCIFCENSGWRKQEQAL